MATADDTSSPPSLLNLPPEILEKILSFLRYEEISNVRLVCTTFDNICQQLLNQGFSNAEKLHSVIYKVIKAKLPRRESERRNHCLARHMDILAALETRLSLLAMTYIKYMELEICCFIPGKVLDEIYKILYRISSDHTPPRPHELLTELRDISSMAMEHFDEKILPIIKSRVKNGDADVNSSSGEQNGALSDHQYLMPGFQVNEGTPRHVINSRMVPLRVELLQLRNSMRSTSSTVVCLRKEVNDYKTVTADQHKKMLEQDKKIVHLNHVVGEMKKKIMEQEKALCDLRNSIVCLEQKFSSQRRRASSGVQCDGVVYDECGTAEHSDRLSCDDDCVASTSDLQYSGGGIPSPDSIDPDSADLKTLLTVLDTEPLLLPVKNPQKRQRTEDADDPVSSSYGIESCTPAKRRR